MNPTKTPKRLDQPSKTKYSASSENTSTASSTCYYNSSGSKLTNSDIAPVHATTQGTSRSALNNYLCNNSNKSLLSSQSNNVSGAVYPSTAAVMATTSTSPINRQQAGGISEVTSDLRDKLNLRNNSNGLMMNGIRMGTTDVEVHYTSVITSTANKTSTSQSTTSQQIISTSTAHSSGNTTNSSVSVRSKITPSPLNNIVNSTVLNLRNCKNEIPLSPPHEPPPPPPSFQDMPPLSPPHEPPPPPPSEEPGGYPFIKSVACRAIGADSPCSSKSSHDGGGGVCNGHTVSEATSNTSIAASSEFSISSERSTDSSFSGARARIRHTSNSSSQSTQPRSDLDLSLASDALKTPEISVSPLPNADDLHVEYVNYENETQMGAIMSLIQKDLSEPYSIYTYRYFIHNWPHLCFLVSSIVHSIF